MENKVRAKKYLGQNFLQEESVVREMADAIPHEKPLFTIEAGPGTGILTRELARVSAKVVSYEIDEGLREVLGKNLADLPNVEVRYADFLDVDLPKEIPVEEPYEYAFASNLPYYVTTPILFKVMESEIPFSSATVMVQKEVADRFLAGENSPDYNDLSVIAQYHFEVKKIRFVGRECFRPVPRVDSEIIRFVRRPFPVLSSDEQGFHAFVRAAFAYRRKTLVNSLGIAWQDRKKAEEIASRAGIDGKKRAQECSVEELVQMYEAVKNAEK